MWGFMTLLVNYKVHVYIEPIILKIRFADYHDIRYYPSYYFYN